VSAASGPRAQGAADSLAVAGVVARFHDALARGDSTGALSLLAEDAVILESGERETRSAYRSHHLPADIAFAQAVRTKRGRLEVKVRDGVAWAASTGSSQGRFGDREVSSATAELMVLSREQAGWRIRAIHWSSRTRRAAAK
jgi:ketosteroid isomerase-like protein